MWKIFEGYEILKYCEKYLKHMKFKKNVKILLIENDQKKAQ